MDFTIKYQNENGSPVVSPVMHIRDVMKIKTMALAAGHPQGEISTEFLVHDLTGKLVWVDSSKCEYQSGEISSENAITLRQALQDIAAALIEEIRAAVVVLHQ